MPKFEVYAEVKNFIRGEIEAPTKKVAEAMIREKMNCFGFVAHELIVPMCKNMSAESYGWDLQHLNVSEKKIQEV